MGMILVWDSISIEFWSTGIRLSWYMGTRFSVWDYIQFLDCISMGMEFWSTGMRSCDINILIFLVSLLANPITVPGVIPKECYEPSTNDQFRYDEQQVCKKLITLSMGKVSLSIHSSIRPSIHPLFLLSQDVAYGQPLVVYCNQLITKLKLNTSDALVVGCGPGYSSFLLAKTFDNVNS